MKSSEHYFVDYGLQTQQYGKSNSLLSVEITNTVS